MIEAQPDLEERPDSGEKEARAFLAKTGLEEEEASLRCSKSSLIGWKARAAPRPEAATAPKRGRTFRVEAAGPKRGR